MPSTSQDSHRWVHATWPGAGWDGPWLVCADIALVELGERVRDALVGAGELAYECRDIGYGVEANVVRGYFTGESTWQGSREFVALDGTPSPLYLFDDEVLSFTA